MDEALPAGTSPPTIVFVYNAQSGPLSMLRDAVHKTFTPQTYPCKLCAITYSPVRMRAAWKRFIRSLPLAVEFSYADLIEQQFGLREAHYPAAFLKSGDTLQPWLSAAQINACDTLADLKALVLKELPQQPAVNGLP